MRQYSTQTPTQHYFNQESQDTKKYFTIQGRIASYNFRLQSAKGVFSSDKLDKGTSILLKHFKKQISFGLSVHKDSQRYLDLGCGYGIVSAWIISYYGANQQSDANTYVIDAIDSAPLAVDLTKLNIGSMLSSGVRNIKFSAYQSDVFSHPELGKSFYDCILTNPPFSAGKVVVQEFIRESHKHLRPGGALWVVAPTNKGAKTYITYTQEIFGQDNVEVIALESGFRVRKATK